MRGRRGDGETGRGGDGESGRCSDGEKRSSGDMAICTDVDEYIIIYKVN